MEQQSAQANEISPRKRDLKFNEKYEESLRGIKINSRPKVSISNFTDFSSVTILTTRCDKIE